MRPLLLCCGLLIQFAAGPLHGAELVGHWDFVSSDGETARDLTGHGHDASIRFGRILKSDETPVLSLDGYLAHGEVPSTRSLTLSDGLTIAAWVPWASFSRNNMIFGKPNTNPAWSTPTVGLYAPDDGRVALALWTSPKTIVASPEPIPIGTWSFVAGTCDKRVARLYVNGQPVAEQPAGKAIAKSDDPFMIGTGTAANHFLPE